MKLQFVSLRSPQNELLSYLILWIYLKFMKWINTSDLFPEKKLGTNEKIKPFI